VQIYEASSISLRRINWGHRDNETNLGFQIVIPLAHKYSLISIVELLDFLIGGEDIVGLVREHSFALDRILGGCEF